MCSNERSDLNSGNGGQGRFYRIHLNDRFIFQTKCGQLTTPYAACVQAITSFVFQLPQRGPMPENNGPLA